MLKQSCKHISNVFVNMSGLEPNIVKFVKTCTVFRQTFQSFLKPSGHKYPAFQNVFKHCEMNSQICGLTNVQVFNHIFQSCF